MCGEKALTISPFAGRLDELSMLVNVLKMKNLKGSDY
jgi:hypothetical protein